MGLSGQSTGRRVLLLDRRACAPAALHIIRAFVPKSPGRVGRGVSVVCPASIPLDAQGRADARVWGLASVAHFIFRCGALGRARGRGRGAGSRARAWHDGSSTLQRSGASQRRPRVRSQRSPPARPVRRVPGTVACPRLPPTSLAAPSSSRRATCSAPVTSFNEIVPAAGSRLGATRSHGSFALTGTLPKRPGAPLSQSRPPTSESAPNAWRTR